MNSSTLIEKHPLILAQAPELPECLAGMALSLAQDLPRGLAGTLARDAARELRPGQDLQRGCPRFLSGLIADPLGGLVAKLSLPSLQDAAYAMAEFYGSQGRGKEPSRGLQNLIPVLIEEAAEELANRPSTLADRRGLRALRLLWAAPVRGTRCQALAARACRLAWGDVKESAVLQRDILLDTLRFVRQRSELAA